MTVDPLSPEARKSRSVFFRLVLNRARGYVCLAFLTPNKRFREQFFEWPRQSEEFLDAIEANILGNNIYFCPQVFSVRARKKENVEATPCAWADLDACPPEEMLVEPSTVLQSSPGRWQAFWTLGNVDPDDAEDLSRRIAYKHASHGADRSGWDLTQLLRVPVTYNYKYQGNAEIPVVLVTDNKPAQYRLSDFEEHYPNVAGYQHIKIPMPDGESSALSGEDIMESKRLEIPPTVWRLFNEEPEGDWSKPLWNLEMRLLELGFSSEEVFAIAKDAKCNKYARDGRSLTLLWKDVCRAAERNKVNNDDFIPKQAQEVPLLSDEERDVLRREKPTFIERYMEWARGLGDAAPQYHQAGAFIALSSLVSGSVRLPTSFGTIIPNLWFMILADTTLTRKTTAMDIAMDLVADIDPDSIMATDGSLEGLLTSLASRPGKPSVFLRDEFSGLLEQMTKKDYMAGMPEMLTKLYDGKLQKRVLRKEIIEVRDPRLIFFAGGIKNKITSLLTFEHVSSGFMPRFVFITAESDISRLRPIGPPTDRITGDKTALSAELTDIYKHYNQTRIVTIEKLKTTIEQNMIFEAELTPEAWHRYNKLEADMLEMGLKSDKPEAMTPMHDRLSKSILKAAVLLSAARQRGEKVMVDEVDILRAIRYGEEWKGYAHDVISNVGKSQAERQIDNVYRAIAKRPTGVTRSLLMQTYHLNARDCTSLLETLEQRGLITRRKQGRTELLIANN